MAETTLTRRAVVQGAVGVAAGAATLVARPQHALTVTITTASPRSPEPIPGGIELAPGQVIHVCGPPGRPT